ncbi:MAG: ABC transporter permease [Actinomycetota bacterium]
MTRPPEEPQLPPEPSREPPEPPTGMTVGRRFIQELTRGNVLVTLLSVVLALLLGAVLIAASDPRVREPAGYFFARPGDMLSGIWTSVSQAYIALFEGSIINFRADTLAGAVRPFTETLTNATPLIAAGLAVAIAFRAGLFNIGAEGQIILGATFAGFLGFAIHLPPVIHLVVAVAGGLVGGAIWGGIVGVLKARTGAHEVIVTIMLNNIAAFLLLYLLGTAAFQRPGRQDPVSPFVDGTAALPRLIPDSRVNLGFVLAIAAALVVWWVLERSTTGFRLRAVGQNPNAARTAGMSVGRTYVVVFLMAGALAGLAGAAEVLGTQRFLNSGISGGLGFDAITVALLGRSHPWGTVAAGLLFGALRAGGVTMQARTGTPVDLTLVIQALVVLFVAAPPLIRAIFRIRVRAAGGPVVTATKGWQ